MAISRRRVGIYLAVCASFLVVGEILDPAAWLYRFDRTQIFVKVYAAGIFLVGLLLGVLNCATRARLIAKGALCGIVSGVIAQCAVMVVNVISLGGMMATINAGETVTSLGIGTLVLITPLWGVLAALITDWLSELSTKP